MTTTGRRVGAAGRRTRWPPWGSAAALAALAALGSAVGCGGEPADEPAADGVAPATAREAGADLPASPRPDHVRLTWLSVTGWLVEAGPVRLVFDGYVGRVDRTTVHDDGTSSARARPDSATVARLRATLLPDGGPEWVLVGHGHWDHALDAPAWAAADGGTLVGAQSVCWQAEAVGLPAARCVPVEGGETLELGPGVRVRVVRWHHSGDSATVGGRRLRAPLELARRPDAGPGPGLRPGFLEDYPNGGGSRAYLLTVETTRGPVRLFWSNTGNPQLWDVAAPVDSVFFRENGVTTDGLRWAADSVPVRERLSRAVAAEGGAGVDVWLGFGSTAHVRQVRQVLAIDAFVPHHWDDFWTPLEEGVDRVFPSTALAAYLAGEGIAFHAPTQYVDAFRVDVDGVAPLGDRGLRDALGLPPPPGPG